MNLKRYYIGNIYKLYSENLRFIGNHPRENIEASYDIITSSNAKYYFFVSKYKVNFKQLF